LLDIEEIASWLNRETSLSSAGDYIYGISYGSALIARKLWELLDRKRLADIFSRNEDMTEGKLFLSHIGYSDKTLAEEFIGLIDSAAFSNTLRRVADRKGANELLKRIKEIDPEKHEAIKALLGGGRKRG
jgi:hypothetical protein